MEELDNTKLALLEEQVNIEDEIVVKNGDLPYVAEDLTRRLGRKVLETDVIAALVRNPDVANSLANKLRILSVIKMFDTLSTLQVKATAAIDDLTAGEQVKMYTSMLGAFNALTIPSTKEVVDWDAQIAMAANEMGVPDEEVRKQLKQAMSLK
jgi:hypothetical protein